MDILKTFILPGLALLPPGMDSPEARAMLYAIGMQESLRFKHRRQVGGPAHGFWQFERGGGISGVLGHAATRGHILKVCAELVISPTEDECYEAVTYNDPLACCFARLLLWTLPTSLPLRDGSQRGWEQYLSAWRPGKPHPETWEGYFKEAWERIA